MVGQINAIHIPRNALSLLTLFNLRKKIHSLLFVCLFRIGVRAEGAVSVQSELESLLITMKITKPSRMYIYSSTEGTYTISLHKDIHVNMHRFIKFLDRNRSVKCTALTCQQLHNSVLE